MTNPQTDVGRGASICTCGHVGDSSITNPERNIGPELQHAGFNGHGACVVTGCPCEKFTWEAFFSGPKQQQQ